MKRITLNFGPFGVYLWGGILLVSGLVYAGGAALTANNYGTIYPKQLANGTPGAGKYPRGGACPTGTSIDTSTGTTDKQCWSKIPAADVDGLPNVNGTPDYVAKFGTSGVVESNAYESGGAMVVDGENVKVQNNGAAGVEVRNASDSEAPSVSIIRQGGTLASPTNVSGFTLLGSYKFGGLTSAGSPIGIELLGYSTAVSGGNLSTVACLGLADGTVPWANRSGWCSYPDTFVIYSGLKLPGVPDMAAGKFLYFSASDGTVAGKNITASDLGINGFDPMGTFFFDTCNSECAAVYPFRLGSLSKMQSYVGHVAGSAPTTLTATCSAGSDAAFVKDGALPDGLISPSESEKKTTGSLWPAGSWLARLRAKVNANGAAIRVHVYEINSSTLAVTEWFNFTTDVFSNTTFATIEKVSTQAQRVPSLSTNYIGFRFYATCSTSTTVSLEFGDASLTTRIESPIVVDRLYPEDVYGLGGDLNGKEPMLPVGKPGQVLGYTGTGTDYTTSKGPVDREPVISGTPGQFVKFKGTGTATTVEKEGVTVTIPTPVTTRSFTVAASALNLGSGAVSGNLSSNLAIWTLRNSQSDYAYGAVITVPNDYASGLSVAPLWYPINADSTQTHTVKWAIGHMAMSDAASYTLTYTSWTGKACGAPCPATYALVRETAFGFGSYSAGDVVAIGIKRLGSDAADTYTGDLALAGLKFTYTSSL